MNGPWHLLKPIARQLNVLKRYNRVTMRSIASQTQLGFLNRVDQKLQVRDARHNSQWAPNVLKARHYDVPIPDNLFQEFVLNNSANYDDLTAVVCGVTGREITYHQFWKRVKKLATSLLKEGFKPGQVIAVALPNVIEFPQIIFGIMEAGLVVSTINPNYTAGEIAYQLKNTRAAAIISIPEKLDAVFEAKDILSKEDREVGSKLRIISTNGILGDVNEFPSGVEKYSAYVSEDVDETSLPRLQPGGRTQNDVVFLPYSSGTTGNPKGVCLTHRNLAANLVAMIKIGHLTEPSGNKQEVLPCILPGFHIYGFSVVLAQSLYYGGKLIMLPKFEGTSFLRALKDYKATVLYVAPPILMYIGSSPNITTDHLASVKIIMCGAAPCTESDIQKCIRKSPKTVVYMQGYGLTETSPSVFVQYGSTQKYSSVGEIVPNLLVKVADLQTGQALGANEEGEICVKGPQVMKGYLNNEKATAEVIDSEGWFHTGDIGYYDEDKAFFITDRLKELIKVKGFQVAPAELEGVLRSHESIEDAGVIGVPDAAKGEKPVAFIKGKQGSLPSIDDLKEFLSKKLAKYKQIDRFIFVNGIPKSAAGKILRKELKRSYFESHQSDT